MKARKVHIGIKNIKTALNGFVEIGEALEQGEHVAKKSGGVYFTSLEAFRKALTPKRLELLRAIKEEKPASINQLSKIVERNIKNVSQDMKYLVQIGLVERKETEKKVTPFVGYDTIQLEIAV